ncbi:MAG TPA: class I adenylate-forming enzyme family protein [Xanthobacteraceae bacterium]|nr:class I adenylate-forming enzyme family protein [Xanthobacteraceae bacterium]
MIRRELHFGDRMVRCHAQRPLHVDAMLRDTVARHPDREAFALGAERITYRALDATVDAVAGQLAARGFGKGDRLALLVGNRLEFVYALLAAARIGVIAVPMNTRQRLPEIAFVLNQCEAAGLIYDADIADQIPVRSAIPSLRDVFVVGGGSDVAFDVLCRPAPVPSCAIAEEDVFCLLYTSGTTGRPKGAMLTHLGTIHSLLHFQYGMDLAETDVTILAVPASHVTGVVAVILTMIRAGGCTVIMSAFKARAFLELAERERMTIALMVPAMYNLCLLDPDFARFDLSAWRLGSFGGAAMPEATIAELARALPGLTLVNVYGATETTSPATMMPLGAIADHSDTVGCALPCADIVVVDEDGREVAPGVSGEIWIAGPMVVPGYWANPEADQAGFSAGYWRSGDVGSIDADGYVRVFDRRKDMINRAGYKVYCIEVENVLSNHPDVVECAVVGRPDAVLGERVQAFVVPRGPEPSAADLRAFCAKRLSDYKVPEIISFLRDPLPRNPNGKVLKAVLRQGVGQGLGKG